MAGIGKDSENLSVNVPSTLMRKLEALAAADHRTKSNYCRMILEAHVKQEELKGRLGKTDSTDVHAENTAFTDSTVASQESTSRGKKPASLGGGSRT